MSDPILLDVDAGLARITLNRPDRLNAVDTAMALRWREVATWAAADPGIGAILLAGAGPAFCAGGDVVHMATASGDGTQITELATVIGEGIRSLIDSAKPVVTAVGGAVAGGGLGLMLTGDWIVAADTARFATKYANLGLTPDLGVSALLPRAIGERRALQLLLSDRTIDAATALEWGLVTEVVAADEVAVRAEAVARGWLAGATAALGQAKRLVRAADGRRLAESMADEAATIGASFDTDAARSRIAAFASGRSGAGGTR